MFRLDGEVFLLGTAMADQLHLALGKVAFRRPFGRAGQIEGAGKNKARSEQETPAGFKQEFGPLPPLP